MGARFKEYSYIHFHFCIRTLKDKLKLKKEKKGTSNNSYRERLTQNKAPYAPNRQRKNFILPHINFFWF